MSLSRYTMLVVVVGSALRWGSVAEAVDFQREIRPILSNTCFRCHGPDEDERKGGTNGLRIDTAEGALEDLGGYAAIVPGNPDESELIKRIVSDDPDARMPPPEMGKPLSPSDIDRLKQWIQEGAHYAQHWSYTPPKPPRPRSGDVYMGIQNPIDQLVQQRLKDEGLQPSSAEDRHALIRRVSLALTGLPPTLDEVQQFVNDPRPNAYEGAVDRLLASPAFGEHWARMWLDLARYADSAGYADDPPRVIWAYRDYVIRSLNLNLPFDQFTIEQLAGDLLPQPTESQLVATAFHRNTMTNSEGGTDDEEFRNAAIVDRVNTTMAVWMGTTIDCCQCHNHKYDPLSQKEFFQLFAIFNNTADSDKADESPRFELWAPEVRPEKERLELAIAEKERLLSTLTPELAAAEQVWEARLREELPWRTHRAAEVKLESGENAILSADGPILIPKAASRERISATVTLATDVKSPAPAPLSPQSLTAIRLTPLPHPDLPGKGPGHAAGNFVITRVEAKIVPPSGSYPAGQSIRIEVLGKDKILALAEVQVFRDDINIASLGKASQSSTEGDAPAARAVDGNTAGDSAAQSISQTGRSLDPWWELQLPESQPIERIVIWNRTGGDTPGYLKEFRITVRNAEREIVWEQVVTETPQPSIEWSLDRPWPVRLSAALADFAQDGFPAANVLPTGAENPEKGWAIGPQAGLEHHLLLLPNSTVSYVPGSQLRLDISHQSAHDHHTLGHFQIQTTHDSRGIELAQLPLDVWMGLRLSDSTRTAEQHQPVVKYFLSIVPELQTHRDELASLQSARALVSPVTTVPVQRELSESQRRVTRIQRRGNFLDLGDEVQAGVPSTFHPLGAGAPDRLALARWLVDWDNPLTARVIVNRLWESLFGVGIVRTSEEFGSQGELPSHPQLLDWLALEFMRSGWDIKYILKQMVMSATYCQSSRVTPELFDRDPENRLLARGPRLRLSAETVRDQILFAAGLLTPRLYGPSTKPPQPALGLNAAFGSAIDWQTSQGADRYRRGLYTSWRRSNPYPSMAAFDAPSREVCTVRRARTNTPLQAFVTLNDPAYIEAAQALARRIDAYPGDVQAKAHYGFQLCVAREPTAAELSALTALRERACQQYSTDPEQARQMATDPLGPVPAGRDVSELAAWTVVANVLLNLDELLMNR